MLDPVFIRKNPDVVRRGLRARGETADLDWYLQRDKDHREVIGELQELKTRQNQISPEIGRRKKAGEDADALLAEVADLKAEQKHLAERRDALEDDLSTLLLRLPNLPDDDVPPGRDDDDNVEMRRHGELREFAFDPKPHWELGADLGMYDADRAGKIAGSGFSLLTGQLAQLERALWNYMLDLHTREHGYTEVAPPYLVREESLIGTSQLPKFEVQMYRCRDDDLFLIPTAEVPVTNIHRGEILSESDLPIRYAAFTPCFRRESGAAGVETRGLVRMHQFHKVELVAFARPEDSGAEHDRLCEHAETVLQQLGLPYRVVFVCSGGMGFGQKRQYDLELHSPGVDRWLEVSSVSIYGAFQARRAGIRFRREGGGKPEFVHTLNGSALAMPRVMVGILENYQREDGSIEVPDVLRPYMGWRAELRAKR